MLGSALNTAVSGLRTQSASVAVTAHNIVNDETPDYQKKQVNIESLTNGSTSLSSLNPLSGGVTFTIAESTSEQGVGSYADDLIQMKRAEQAYTSSALVLSKVDEMYETLLDAIG